jgi:tetratricopeptide (TPR) repeat protein
VAIEVRKLAVKKGWAEPSVDGNTVSRWERGIQLPNRFYQVLLAETFGVHPAELGLNGPLRRRLDPVKRREFLRGIVGAASASAGLTDVLGPKPTDYAPAERFELVRMALADNDNLLGPRSVIPAALAQVRAMETIGSTLRGADFQKLLHVQTQYADLLGWLYQDSRSFQLAQLWMERALEWARLAGDSDSVIFVLARTGQLAGDMRDPNAAIATAEAAMRVAQPSNRLGAVAATYAAHGYALRNDPATCARLYDDAVARLSRAEAVPSPWAQFFDLAYIMIQRAHSLSMLGDHRAAADVFRSAINQLQPGFRRDRGVYLAWEAVARARAGEIDRAAGLGMEALHIAAETSSQRIFAELRGLKQLLQGSPEADSLRFRDALHTSWGTL